MFSIRTNTPGTTAARNQANATRDVNGAFSRLASGYRVSRAFEDAAGMGVATNMSAQLRSLQQSSRNAMAGRSVIQTSESALGQSAALVTRMRELTVQGLNGSVGAEDLKKIKTELSSLGKELQRISDNTEYNGTKLLDGSKESMSFQVGAGGGNEDVIEVDLDDAGLDALNLSEFGGDPDAMNLDASSLDKLDAALEQISSQRASLGAASNRLDSAMESLDVAAVSIAESRSRITDADIAEETSNLSKAKVLQNAGVAMQVQASKISKQALRLLDPQKS
jgi:flagellin